MKNRLLALHDLPTSTRALTGIIALSRYHFPLLSDGIGRRTRCCGLVGLPCLFYSVTFLSEFSLL